MGLSKEEKTTLEALLAKEKEDEDEDFEIEIWSGNDGARVPYKKGKDWFEKTFGVKLTPDDSNSGGGKRQPTKRQPSSQSDDDGDGSNNDTTVLRHFGPRKAAS